ncbi:FG-GAP-like repeat-containing protein [Thermopolyspora sp. NPDC052614]|uniref:FG-GAP-like repeat-containing protein n=1 Tax=Thermopolyspora sp. NPDC052614 TaxID=3155682 RepID=UPI003425C147
MRAAGVLAASLLLLAATNLPAANPIHARTHGSNRAACGKTAWPDFNGDGHADLAVGDPHGRTLQYDQGSLHLLRGTAEGLPRLDASDAYLTGARGPMSLRLADVDGDGCADLVAGGPYGDDRGHATIYWGGPGRSSAARITDAKLTVGDGEREWSGLGWSVAAGQGVVAVGAPFEDVDGVTDAGAVYVFTVGADRDPSEPIRITQSSPDVPGGDEPGDLFGWSLALGRLGGDPAALDLVIGAPFDDKNGKGPRKGPRKGLRKDEVLADAGAVTVLYDVTSGARSGTRWNLAEVTSEIDSRAGDRFGYSLAYGEWRGTGRLAVGAPGADVPGADDAGMVQLFEGTEPTRSLWQGWRGLPDAGEKGDGFGYALAFAGGHLLIGSPFEADRGLPEVGAVTVVPLDGSPATFVTEGRARMQAYDHFGWAVSAAGDGWMAVGVPDEQATHGGAIALVPLRGGEPHLLAPGYNGIPHLPDQGRRKRPYPHEIGRSVDFGAVLAG